MPSRPKHAVLAAVVAAASLHVIVSPATAQFTPFSGELGAARAAFEAAVGEPVPTETFESFALGEEVGSLPSVDAFFAPEDEFGNPLPLPGVLATSPISAPIWTGNAVNGRPPWSPWVLRPNGDGAIYAFGQASSQGDWVRVSAYDAQDQLVGSVDSLPISHSFAGFISTVPIKRIVITPLGNFDGRNGMDDVQVRVTPVFCVGDIIEDGTVDVQDLLALLAGWGPCPGCAADLNGDDGIDVQDLLTVLAAWGPCP